MEERFLRHYIIKEIGKQGQENISKGKVLVVGAGGLGSPAIIYLAANGIGKLGIADYDTVDITNIHRQIIHYKDDLKRKKTESAIDKIKKINEKVELEIYNFNITDNNSEEIFKDYDFIIDASDNIKTKLLINDTCVKLCIPFNYSGINSFFGSSMTVVPGKTACLRCVFTNINEEIEKETGVFGPVPGVLGTLQAAEALKYVGKFGNLLTDKMLTIDVFHMEFGTINVLKSDKCICKNSLEV